jgi:hypothetical protein
MFMMKTVGSVKPLEQWREPEINLWGSNSELTHNVWIPEKIKTFYHTATLLLWGRELSHVWFVTFKFVYFRISQSEIRGTVFDFIFFFSVLI